MSQATVYLSEIPLQHAAAIKDQLEGSGHQVQLASSSSQALDMMNTSQPGLIFTTDKQVLRFKREQPDVAVIVLTDQLNVEAAVAAMHAGASDVLVLPVDAEVLHNRLTSYFKPVKSQANHTVIAEDIRTRELLNLAFRVSQTEATVMISGESGTGKEVFARYIHQHSNRSEGPFVAINCAAIPDNMLESVLFGYEKGAFTGAYRSSPGKFEQAQGGTLLLDEISEMSLDLQAKLLRVLQEWEVERLGGQKIISLDVRVLATTNRKLREEVAAGRFREDLFYRLNVFPLALAPLRERERDVLPLVEKMVQKYVMPGQPVPRIGEDAKQVLLSYPWPGNVRELDNLIQRSVILHSGPVLTAKDLMFEQEGEAISTSIAEMPLQASNKRLTDDLKHVEEQMILDALQLGHGSRKQAAEQLGISPRTLRYKIAKLRDAGIEIPR